MESHGIPQNKRHPLCHAGIRPQNIKYTLKYTQLVSFKDDEYICKVAKNLDEAKELIELGFEYVTGMDGVKLFRKRK